jgi:hypothetical protein
MMRLQGLRPAIRIASRGGAEVPSVSGALAPRTLSP